MILEERQGLRKLVAVAVTVLMCAALCVGLAVLVRTPAEAARTADATTGATPNYRTFLEQQLKDMPMSYGNYTCLKAQEPYTYFTQEWFGVNLSYLMDVEIGLKDDTTGIKFIAADDYSVTIDMDQLRNQNPDGLSSMLGYVRGEENEQGGERTVLDDEEGPFRLIVPQEVPGPFDEGGTPNWQLSVRQIRAIEVQPVQPGLPTIDPQSIPAGEIVVYGNILSNRAYTVDQLKSMPDTSGEYHTLNKGGFEDDYQCNGVTSSDFLLDVAGIPGDTDSMIVGCADGFGKQFDIDEVLMTYPGDLETMLAYDIYDVGNQEEVDMEEDGPIMWIRPQEDAADTNKSDWMKQARVFEAVTADAGADAKADATPDPTRVPADRVIASGPVDPHNVPSTWYFAEGYTGSADNFETWLCIGNPNSWETEVEITYMTEEMAAGAGVQTQELTVAPRSRTTVNVNDQVGPDKNVSARVEGYHGDSLVVERAMYWNGRQGGHCVTGVTELDDSWFLAEGCTGEGFETWVLLQNPNDDPANAELTFMTGEGEVDGPDVALPANSRVTVDVSQTVPDNMQVSTAVESDQPIVAERAMYWNDREGGHDEVAVDSPKIYSLLAEGCTEGGFETWILLQNPGIIDATVYITYLTGEGAVERAPLEVPAGQRVSVNVANDVGATYNVSAQISSTVQIAVERSVYWNNRVEGTCARGYLDW